MLVLLQSRKLGYCAGSSAALGWAGLGVECRVGREGEGTGRKRKVKEGGGVAGVGENGGGLSVVGPKAAAPRLPLPHYSPVTTLT